MKMMKFTLLAVLFLGGGLYAQFTTENAPQIGDQIELYVMDSSATSFPEITGNDVTWDYSNLSGYGLTETKTITAMNTSATDFAADFPSSEKAIEIEDFLYTFYNESASERNSQGFALVSDIFGIVLAKITQGHETLLTYPFDFGSEVSSTFGGAVDLDLGQIITLDLDGNSIAKVDGVGTLKLPINTYSNVYRYNLLDTLMVEDPDGVADIEIVRNQYEYYDFSVSNLPIFFHIYVTFRFSNSPEPIGDFTVVLSRENGDAAGISTNILETTSVYPNPTTAVLNIQLPASIDQATVQILDASGRKVQTNQMTNDFTSLNVSSLNSGTYLVKITSSDNSIVKRVVIN